MSRLLAIIESDLLAVREEYAVNFDILRRIIEYMVDYPDAIHHPKEDLVFDLLVKRDRDALHVVENLRREHRKLKECGVVFRDMLELVTQDGVVLRQQLVDAGHDYLNLLKDHMSEEESVVFPWASRYLTVADWQSVAEAFPQAPDPLFGPEVARHFASLYQCMQGDSQMENFECRIGND